MPWPLKRGPSACFCRKNDVVLMAKETLFLLPKTNWFSRKSKNMLTDVCAVSTRVPRRVRAGLAGDHRMQRCHRSLERAGTSLKSNQNPIQLNDPPDKSNEIPDPGTSPLACSCRKNNPEVICSFSSTPVECDSPAKMSAPKCICFNLPPIRASARFGLHHILNAHPKILQEKKSI